MSQGKRNGLAGLREALDLSPWVIGPGHKWTSQVPGACDMKPQSFTRAPVGRRSARYAAWEGYYGAAPKRSEHVMRPQPKRPPA